jgi:UDP-N-acetylglucosamine transferase subunit ALG13
MSSMNKAAIVTDHQRIANNALLDFVVMQTCTPTDAMLAATLRISRPGLSKIRNGHLHLSATIQLAMIEYCGISLAQIRRYVPARGKRP